MLLFVIKTEEFAILSFFYKRIKAKINNTNIYIFFVENIHSYFVKKINFAFNNFLYFQTQHHQNR